MEPIIDHELVRKRYLDTLQLAPSGLPSSMSKQEGCGLAITPSEIADKAMKAAPKIFVIIKECYCHCYDIDDKPMVSAIKAFTEESAAKAYLKKQHNSCYRIVHTKLL